MTDINIKIKQAFDLQKELNSIIDPKWEKAGNPWYRASWVEAGEALSHFGYKWWKHEECDREQLVLELVDIFHFFMSEMIENKATPDSLVTVYESAKNRHAGRAKDKEAVIEEVETFIVNAITSRSVSPIRYMTLIVMFGVTLEEVLDMYIPKNTLNVFRQRNGYRDGSYIKQWGEFEDNQVLSTIVNQVGPNADEIMAKLEVEYSNVKGSK